MNRSFASCLYAGVFTVGLSAFLPAAAQPMERARAAQTRGDLRTAQIEFRNAVRDDPRSPAARTALVIASLDLGDTTTAEKEARTALELGADPVAGTALLLQALLSAGKYQVVLQEFPQPTDSTPIAGQVAAARGLAQLGLNQVADAAASVEAAVRIAPDAVQPHLAAAALAAKRGDWAASEAAADRALAIDPNSAEGLLRKAGLLLRQGKQQAVVDVLSPLLARSPGNVSARLRRAEAELQLGDDGAARRDVDAGLATLPGSVVGAYLRAVLRARGRDWRGADEDLQRIGPQLSDFPTAYLLQAVVRRALGQAAGAEESARRYVARHPEDLRGAKLLAALELEAGRPDSAAGTLTRLIGRGEAGDAEAFYLLGRAHAGARRMREAAEALSRAAALAPNNAEIWNQLAAARLGAGDAAGSAEAGKRSLQLQPGQPRVQELLAATALLSGDLTGATADLGQVDAAKRSEAGSLTDGLLHLARLDIARARGIFEAVLREHPGSNQARLGLAQVATFEGNSGEAERLLGEVLRQDPANVDAVGRLAALAQPGKPSAVTARAALEAAQAASPTEPALAMALAGIRARTGDAAGAAALLDNPAFRVPGGALTLPLALARSDALAAAGRWDDARGAARLALSENPASVAARLRLAALTSRANDPSADLRAAEALVQEGLRSAPGDGRLQGALVGLTLRARGLDAALALADQLAAQPNAMPAAATLRGDAYLAANRKDDAIRAYAAAAVRTPTQALALRSAVLLSEAGKPAEATAILQAWLQRAPDDVEVLSMLGGMDIAANRLAEAETRLTTVVERQPSNSVALNNLAWVVDRRGEPGNPKARQLAERAYFLSANSDTADTLGWILVRGGQPQLGVQLLRQSIALRPPARQVDPSAAWRLAYGLQAAGAREEALRVLEPALAGSTVFPERAEAERLRAELRAGR